MVESTLLKAVNGGGETKLGREACLRLKLTAQFQFKCEKFLRLIAAGSMLEEF